MTSPTHIYELRDATDDERYWVLGVFLSLAEAVQAVNDALVTDNLWTLGPMVGEAEEALDLEVFEITIGETDPTRKVVWRAELRQDYDEATDETSWRMEKGGPK